LKAKTEELETNGKINNIRDLYRGMNDVKKGYQPRTGIVKDEKGDLVADSHSFMARWRNYFSQILTLRRLMSYIYGAPILDVSRSHTTQQSVGLLWTSDELVAETST